jgi:hypothetical protein
MISTMLSGTAGTSLRESRRPPAWAPRPGSPHPAGITADPDTVQCASPAVRQSPAPLARHRCPPAAPAATGKPARQAARPGLSHEPASGETHPRVRPPQGGRGYRHDFRGTAGRVLRLDAGGALCRCPFGQRPRRGAAMPGTAVRRQQDHPGRHRVAASSSFSAGPGLHQPGWRGGRRRPDRADVQPPPVPPAGAAVPGS